MERVCEACGFLEMTRRYIKTGFGLTNFYEYQCPECDFKFRKVA
jgi:hypothetical protein